MAAQSKHRVTVVALLFFSLLFAPNFSPTVYAQGNRPQVVFAPSPGMPLPTPATPGVVTKPAPISGVLRILVIAAAFSDINHTISIGTLKAEFFGGVADYYKEISYGAVTLTGDIFGWYTLPYPESHYGRDCLAIDDADCSGSDGSWQIAEDVAQIAQQKDNVNFMNYDYYVFIHSGNGQESSGVKDDVWSVTYLGGVWVRTNLKTLTKFQIVPEEEAGGAVPEGVFTHEFGHLLGLPDLYNTNTGKSIMGPWSLMDKGLWNGNPPGSSPAHMEAWSKIQLGFIGGTMLATASLGVTSSFTIDPTEVASSNVHAVMIALQSGPNPSQYYLVEVRETIGFDSALPATGVLITYVDNTLLVGRLRVIDGHPSVPGLDDATWDVGQTYTDTKNNLAISLTGQVGHSFQVTVNRGPGQPPPPYQNQTYVDLAVSNVNAQPQVITQPNTTVTITILISNLGTKAATNVPVEADLDGQSYASSQISVGAGSSTQTSFTWTSTIGSHVFRVIIDPNNSTNDTNRANNIATFTVNVGPTLTIDIPINVTSAGSIWVLINGVRYNLTSGQLQASVPNGTVTVEIQSTVNTATGVRQLFTGWGDGNFANPRQITVISDTVIQAMYATQFLLFVDHNGGTTTSSGWYNANTVATVYAVNPANVTVNTSRLLFSGWSGDVNSNSTSLTVNMTKPVSLRADWTKQYYITIVSPTGSPTGSGWYNAGSIATVGILSTVQYSNGTQQVFTGWNSTVLGRNPTGQIMVNSPTILMAAWKTQYFVSILSQYGTPLGSGWYDIGSTVPVYIQAEVDYANSTRRTFAGWTGDYVGPSNNVTLRVSTPRTLAAIWNTEYLVTFKVNGVPNSTVLKLNLNETYADLSVNNYYQAWYQKGAIINPLPNQTVVEGIMVHKFTGWRNATGGLVQAPWTVNTPGTYVASYTTELTLPPIPGFPIEGIILGILIGLLMLVVSRRRKRSTVVNVSKMRAASAFDETRNTDTVPL